MIALPRTTVATYARSVIFGVEDSVVSTVGLLSGIAVAAVPQSTIVLTGIVLIAVEALSMAVGSFLSETSAEEYLARGDSPATTAVVAGVIMFASYFVSGFIPLAPYVFASTTIAFPLSVAVSLLALFLLGLLSGRMTRVHVLWSGTRMLVLGGLAIGIGVLVGSWVHGVVR